MSKVILVCHGETVFSRAMRYSGQRETPLTPHGVAQHTRLRARLATEPIDRVVCSDLERCRTLADQIASDHGIEAEHDTIWREASFGIWEGITYDEAMIRYREAMVAFNRDQVHVAPPGGESLATLEARVRHSFATLVKAQKGHQAALLLVSHGGALRALLCGLLAIPLDRYWTLRVDQASLTMLDIYPLGPIVAVLNDTCHLHDLPVQPGP